MQISVAIFLKETLVGLHRHFNNYSEKAKVFIVFITIIDCITSIAFSIYYFYEAAPNFVGPLSTSIIMLFSYNSLLLLPIINSVDFIELYNSIDILWEFYKSVNIRKRGNVTLNLYLSIITLASITCGLYIEVGYVENNQNTVFATITRVYSIFYNLKFYLNLQEYVLLLSKLVLIVECIESKILDVIEEISLKNRVNMSLVMEDLIDVKVDSYGENIKMWESHYRILIKCSRLITKCFKIQVILPTFTFGVTNIWILK
jgi:hypothetical protein